VAVVLFVEPDNTFFSAVPALLKRVDGMECLYVPGTRGAEDYVSRQPASVLAIGPGIAADEALALARRVAPRAVVLVTNRPTAELMRQAMRAGVKDVLAATESPDEIAASIVTADEAARLSAAGAADAPVAEVRRSAHVISVFSTKGGVGKSTLATNLAVSLAGMDRSVILVDLDLQFGDVAIMLQLAPDRTIYDAVQAIDRLDEHMLRGFFAEHSSGVSALLAPRQPEEAESVTAPRVSRILDLVGGMCDFVVIDTPPVLNDTILTALDHTDEIYAIATMDVPSIKNTRISLQKLRQLGYAEDAIRLVLNRADSKVWLEMSEVEKVIEEDVAVRIPSDRSVPRSVNKGVPIVLEEPRSSVARTIESLTKEIVTRVEGVGENVA
jgi:pilus assembly protein CpaE